MKRCTTQEAFFRICANASPASGSYISLYRDEPFYGGPEEGGWWGSDTVLVAYHKATTDKQADEIREKVTALAAELTRTSDKAWAEQCRSELDWAEERGLDADVVFGESAGADRFWIAVESIPGSLNSTGDRGYS